LETSKRIVNAASRSISKAGDYILHGDNMPKKKITLKDQILSGPINAAFNRFYV